MSAVLSLIKVSDCCGAMPHGELYNDMGMCSDCYEYSGFSKEEDL